MLSTQSLGHLKHLKHAGCRICCHHLCSLTSFYHIMLQVRAIWPPNRVVCFISVTTPTPRDMVEGKWRVNNNSTRSNILHLDMGVTSETWHTLGFSPCLRRTLAHRAADAQPALINHTNDDGFPPLCNLITSCPGFYHRFPGQSGPPLLLPVMAFFFLTPCHPEQSQLKNSFISPPSTPLITNSAESWKTQKKRQISLAQDINKMIRNKHSEALRSWENFNLLTPAFQKSRVFSHNYEAPRVSSAWGICWHTPSPWLLFALANYNHLHWALKPGTFETMQEAWKQFCFPGAIFPLQATQNGWGT